MMKRLVFLLLISVNLPAMGQNLKDLFVEMPDTVFSILTKVNRADFGDFLDSNMKAIVRNRFGKETEMKVMTNDYLQLNLTVSSRVEMKYLPVNDSTKVICVAKTYLSPAADTQLSFYDESWRMLPTDEFITLPQERDYFTKTGEVIVDDSLSSHPIDIDIFLQEARLCKDTHGLTFKFTSWDYVERKDSVELRKKVATDQLSYKWENGKFIRNL